MPGEAAKGDDAAPDGAPVLMRTIATHDRETRHDNVRSKAVQALVTESPLVHLVRCEVGRHEVEEGDELLDQLAGPRLAEIERNALLVRIAVLEERPCVDAEVLRRVVKLTDAVDSFGSERACSLPAEVEHAILAKGEVSCHLRTPRRLVVLR
jgi:hypothetical protein